MFSLPSFFLDLAAARGVAGGVIVLVFVLSALYLMPAAAEVHFGFVVAFCDMFGDPFFVFGEYGVRRVADDEPDEEFAREKRQDVYRLFARREEDGERFVGSGEVDPEQGAYRYVPLFIEVGRDHAEPALREEPDGDADEGRERVGMGLLLAKWCTLHPDARLRGALVRYAAFVRRELQTADYTTYSQTGRRGYHRGYNYPWVADFYFHMYDLTGDARYAADGYGTLCAFFRHFGYGFYAIDIPVLESMKALERAGMSAERDTLLAHYRRTAARFAKTGPLFPRHEVNYEQSIVAPAVAFMAEMYLQTADTACLAYVRRLMPALEAFAGSQPAYNLNGIAIRHWDGYWFGKRRIYGDTFPHYWSVLTGNVFELYGRITKDPAWLKRAEDSRRGVLGLIFPDGRASCACVFPHTVNGVRGEFFDEYANDQDWGLYYYLRDAERIGDGTFLEKRKEN